MNLDKKIFCIGPCGNLYKGGIAQFFSSLTNALSQKGEVVFYTWERMYPAFLLKREFKDKVSQEKVSQVSGKPLLDFYNPISLLKLFFLIRKEVSPVVILNWAHPVHAFHYILLLLLLKAFTSSEKYLICHNVDPHESFKGAGVLTRFVFNLVDCVVVHSSSEQEKARLLVSKNVQVLELFMPLFDFNKTRVEPSSKKTNKILFFGIIRDYKGVDILVNAFAKIINKLPALTLVIAGENFYKKKDSSTNLQEMVASQQVEDRVCLINRYIANEEIPEIFSDCDVVVFPFRSVTQSASLTLALAHHKPVIVSDLPAFTSMITEGKTGAVFKNKSVEDLAEAILRFYQYPDMSDNIVRLGEKLTWDKYAKLLLERKNFIVD